MRSYQHFVLSSIILSALTGCGSAPDRASHLHLTNSILAAEGEFPAVVLIAKKTEQGTRYCTATFVNDHQVVTAAHCLGEGGSAADLYLLAAQGSTKSEPSWNPVAAALRAHVHPQFQFRQDTMSSYDLAVIDFPAGSGAGTMQICRNGPSVNTPVTLVGFGGTESTSNGGLQSATSPSEERYGSNTVRTHTKGLVSFSGLPRSKDSYPLGEFVSSTAGDSGSPWLTGGQIVSITIGAEVKRLSQGQVLTYTYAVDLSQDEIRSFLLDAIE